MTLTRVTEKRPGTDRGWNNEVKWPRSTPMKFACRPVNINQRAIERQSWHWFLPGRKSTTGRRDDRRFISSSERRRPPAANFRHAAVYHCENWFARNRRSPLPGQQKIVSFERNRLPVRKKTEIGEEDTGLVLPDCAANERTNKGTRYPSFHGRRIPLRSAGPDHCTN